MYLTLLLYLDNELFFLVAGSTWQTTQSASITKTNLAEIKSGSVDKFHKLHAAGAVLFHVDILTDGQT